MLTKLPPDTIGLIFHFRYAILGHDIDRQGTAHNDRKSNGSREGITAVAPLSLLKFKSRRRVGDIYRFI